MKKTMLKLACSLGLLAVIVTVAAMLWWAPSAEAARPRCAGLAGLKCPSPRQICIDDPSDGCDPKLGHTDCVGICVGPRGRPQK